MFRVSEVFFVPHVVAETHSRGGEGDSNIKKVGVLVVSLRGVNLRSVHVGSLLAIRTRVVFRQTKGLGRV